MFTPLHPRWGRLIGALDATPNTIRLVLSADDERSGREALENICHQATMPIRDRGQDIDISALDSSLRLAQDPKTIRHLARPLVISGCIKLLGAAVAQRGRFGSPFRYEYGYLCLRLLVASVNVCLLDRYGQLDEALEACEENDQYAADYLASVALASVVESQFQITHNGINTTWDSGWAIPNPEEGPLVPRSDLSTLLGLLWNDRKFIIATSGFSGLLFLLSQHVFQEKYIHKNPDGEKLKRRMYELGLRYLLVAERSQRGATLRAIDANHPDTEGWSRNAKHVDAEDSRLLMTALIKRLPIGDDRSVFVTREPSVMFRLITISTDPETQDLLPGAIRCAIEYGWAMLFGMNIDLDQRFQGTARTVFGILTQFVCPTHNPEPTYLLGPDARVEILTALRDSELLDLAACMIVDLNPTESGATDFVFHCMTLFFAALSQRVPESERRDCFQAYVPAWSKFNRHLMLLRDSILTVPVGYRSHYNKCLHFWFQFAQFLGLAPIIEKKTGMSCSNARCPMGSMNDAVEFGCSGYAGVCYCNDQCQSIDWMLGKRPEFHTEVVEEGD